MEKRDKFEDVDYESLDLTNGPTQMQANRPGSTKYTRLWSFAAGVVIASLLFLAAMLTIHVLSPKPNPDDMTAPLRQMEQGTWNDCGTTSETAISQGCVMEPLIYGWMPPQCVYEELTGKYPVFEDRIWYTDQNHSDVIPREDLWMGKHIHIYADRFHTEHCLFQWRKLQYSMYSRKEWLDNKTTNWEHTSHCADILSREGYFKQADGPESRNSAGLGFYICDKTIW